MFIEKTDIYRDEAWLVIGRTGSKLCPVACMEKYLHDASIDPGSDEYVFRNVNKCQSGFYLRKLNHQSAYDLH